MTAPLDLHQLRDNLREVTAASEHNTSVEQLWLHVGALTAILDALLSEMVRVYDETTAMVDATQYVTDEQAGNRMT